LPGCEGLTEEMTSTIRANQGRGCLLGRQKAFNDLLSRLLSAIDFMSMIYELSAGAGYRIRTCDPVITNNMIVISVWFPDYHHVSGKRTMLPLERTRDEREESLAEQIEERLRDKFEEDLEDEVEKELDDDTREEREEALAEKLAEELTEQFEEDLEDQIDAELEREMEDA
jgi:hypothetical protein